MAEMVLSVEDVSILADAYPDKTEWQRVAYWDGKLIFPDDLYPAISIVDMPAARKATLLAYARQKRWQIETGGIEVGGMPIATDDRSKLMIAGARTSADSDPDFETSWDAGEMDVDLNAEQIIAISDAVRDHVAAVFAKFKTIRADINAGTLTSKSEVDAAYAA